MAAVICEPRTHVLKLPEDVLVRILTAATSALSVADVLSFGTANNACLGFVRQSSRLWVELLTIHFPEQEVSEESREDAQYLRCLFIER